MTNKRALEELALYASDDWKDVPPTHQAGKQGMRMKAALEMVLMFHCSRAWSEPQEQKWVMLQQKAGIETPNEAGTTKVLCDTIRQVLEIDLLDGKVLLTCGHYVYPQDAANHHCKGG